MSIVDWVTFTIPMTLINRTDLHEPSILDTQPPLRRSFLSPFKARFLGGRGKLEPRFLDRGQVVSLKKVELLMARFQIHTEEHDKTYLYTVLGLSVSEVQGNVNLLGPLCDLKASSLLKGAFDIALTQIPSEHLTFNGPHRRSTLRLLNAEGMSRLYIPQRIGIARALCLKLIVS
jgi:hypothetical protein